MYQRAYHITMFTLALFLTILGTGNPYVLLEKTKDTKPWQMVLSEGADKVLHKVEISKIKQVAAAPQELQVKAVFTPCESVAVWHGQPVAAASVSKFPARASPAAG